MWLLLWFIVSFQLRYPHSDQNDTCRELHPVSMRNTKILLWVRRAKFGYIMYWENPLDCFYSWIYRSGKASVKGGSSPPAGKKAPLIRRAEDQRSSSTKRREPSPPTRKAPPASKSGQPPVRKRSLTPVGRNSSGHRRRSQTPPHSSGGKNKPTSSSRSSLSVKQPGTVVCFCSV